MKRRVCHHSAAGRDLLGQSVPFCQCCSFSPPQTYTSPSLHTRSVRTEMQPLTTVIHPSGFPSSPSPLDRCKWEQNDWIIQTIHLKPGGTVQLLYTRTWRTWSKKKIGLNQSPMFLSLYKSYQKISLRVRFRGEVGKKRERERQTRTYCFFLGYQDSYNSSVSIMY